MSERGHKIPTAKVEKSYLTWVLWALPAAAVALCGWFLLQDYVLSGPTIEITFESADGLQEKNSMVKYHGIQIGEVEGLKLAKDQQHVVVTATLDRSAAGVARAGSQFWIVTPRVSLGGIQGLQTIVAGDYVTVLPGDGVRTNKFEGLSQPPIEHLPSLHITLLTHDLGAIQKKSPILYGGIQVGEVIDCHLADDATTIVIDARILQAYAPLVRLDSQFWNAGGLNIHAGLFRGLDISADSVQTVVSGGIGFATPNDYGPPATNGTIYTLNEQEAESWKDWWPAIPVPNVPDIDQPTNTLPKYNVK
jgi:paraquat-inducible protein B